jgi:hypothetical protein
VVHGAGLLVLPPTPLPSRILYPHLDFIFWFNQ